MTNRFIVTGTDTEIGKTVFSAALMLALHQKYGRAHYWKSVQSGIAEGTDTKTVKALTGLPEDCFLPEAYVLNEPLSPHRSAELDGVEINPDSLVVPDVDGPLVIEGAGGLMVPLTRDVLYIDVFQRWDLPVILCARTGLGTINHTLLSIEALKARDISIHGIAFIGEDHPDNVQTIAEFSGVKVLGCLPILKNLDPKNVQQNFENHFDFTRFVIPSEAKCSRGIS